jgi:hypothetical protein
LPPARTTKTSIARAKDHPQRFGTPLPLSGAPATSSLPVAGTAAFFVNEASAIIKKQPRNRELLFTAITSDVEFGTATILNNEVSGVVTKSADDLKEIMVWNPVRSNTGT